MRLWKPNRRWLQFSVRGLLLLTLAVALWLGHEVRHAHRVERTTAAVRAWDGEAEWLPGGWSLLKFVIHGAYGQRIVKVEIPGEAIGDVIDRLAELPDLSEVRIVYDGSDDICRNWERLNTSLPRTKIVTTAERSLQQNGSGRFYDAMPSRLANKLHRPNSKLFDLVSRWRERTDPRLPSFLYPFEYHILRTRDGTLLELLVSTEIATTNPGDQEFFAIMLVGGKVIDCARFEDDVDFSRFPIGRREIHVEDLDGDGCPELAVECHPGPGWSSIPDLPKEVRQLPGDPRYWLGDIYKIKSDGFYAPLPQAKMMGP